MGSWPDAVILARKRQTFSESADQMRRLSWCKVGSNLFQLKMYVQVSVAENFGSISSTVRAV